MLPLINVYAGYRVVDEVWRCSAPKASNGDWKRGRAPTLLLPWWTCVVLMGFRFVAFGAGQDARLIELANLLRFTQLIAALPAGLGAVWIVLAVDARQARSARDSSLNGWRCAVSG